MYHKLIIKASVLISALIALNTALNAFGYGMILQMWAVYLALISSMIVLFAFGAMLVMHGGHMCHMCCHSNNPHAHNKGNCMCGKENCRCK